MKKSFSFLFISFCLAFVASAQSVTIGTQVWMTKNLDVTTFLNGDPIPEADTAEEWELANKNKKPAWCYHGQYDKVYNWYAVNDPRGLAPFGYHVPTNAEWNILINYAGGQSVAGRKLKSTKGWIYDGAAYDHNTNGYRIIDGKGTDEFGFSGLACGRRHSSGDIGLEREYGYYWSSTEYNTDFAWRMSLYYNMDAAYRSYYNKGSGLSVRCVKDKFID